MKKRIEDYPQPSNFTIKRRIKGFIRFCKRIRKKLTCSHSEEFADAVLQQTRREFEKLLSHIPTFRGLNNAFSRVIVYCAYMVSFYKAMKANARSVEEVVGILYENERETYDSLPRFLRYLVKRIMFGMLFLNMANRMAANVYHHTEGWKIEYKTGDGEESDWYFECKECGVIKFFKRHGAEELGNYCNFIDYMRSKTFDMGMQNPRNIGQGHDVCVQYMKRDRKTELPENLKPLLESLNL